MSLFDDRANSFEKKYANDQQTRFRIEARTSKMMGLWAAVQLGLSGDAAESYAKEVVSSNLDEAGFNDVKRKIAGDFSAKGLTLNDADFEKNLIQFLADAESQIINEG